MKKRVLVTGHLGYIGSVMTRFLQDRGYEVTGLDNGYFSDCILGPTPQEFPAIRKDLRDVTENDLKGFYAIVHLAAICNDPLGNLNADWTYDINHKGSVALAKKAKNAGVERFLFSSSCSMHGKSLAEKVTEQTPVHPLTPYGESKIKAEEEIGQLADDSFCPSYLRNGTVYGVSPRMRLDIVLNNLVGWAYTTGHVKIMTDGSPWRPVIHVEDVCLAFSLVLEAQKEKVSNQAFHVGSNKQNFRVKDLAEIAKKTVPGCALEYVNEPSADQRTYIADFSKLENTFPAFKPKWDPESGARQLHSAYQECRLQAEDMSGNRYVRLNRIKKLITEGQLDDTLRWKNGSSK